MRFTFKYILSLLIILQFSNCKKDEESTVLVNASVANSAEGSVSFSSGDYVAGTTVTFTATPRDGYVFTNWTNTSTNQIFTTNPLSIKVNENTNLVANFEKAAYNVMFTISGEGNVEKEVIGGGGFTHGSEVQFTAIPSENYSFFYWNNDPGDTDNPKTVTLDSNLNVPARFDYQVARDLVGNWEFEISDPASKNSTTIKMSVDIFLNVLMTTIVNGEVISQIFTQMIAISTSAIVIGDFAVITDVVVESATSLNMNMVSIPEGMAPPTNESEIPETNLELNLSGNKSNENPQTDDDGIIIPPTGAISASSTSQDIGDLFNEIFSTLVVLQNSNLSSDTLDTGTSTSTTQTAVDTSCSLEATLKSESSDNQTVVIGSPIVEVIYDIETDCSRVIHLVSSIGLPSGVIASITGDELKISGTPTEETPGTFNYSIVIDNHLEQTSSAPFVSATVSKVISGSISLINTETTSSTDGGDDSAEQQTFLERYNGVGFAGDEEYFFFNDDDIFLKYVDVYEDGNECSEVKEGSNTIDEETVTIRIVTNTYNRLKIELIEDGETSNIEFVSTADGNSLQVYDDDDDNNEDYYVLSKTTESFESLCANERQTFLERYNGVGFADDEEYFFFNDNDVLIKYVFVSNENGNECSELKEGTNTVDGETFTLRIVTNSYDRLKIEITEDGETHNIEFVSTADGNSLQVYDDDDDNNEDYYVLSKTTESFESLCANERQTFLERYNGVGFADDEEYFFFNDNDVLIKYVFVSNENGNECSELKEGTNTVDGETFTLRIVTNSYDRLKIEITEDGETHNIEFVSTADGNSLQVYDDDDGDNEGQGYYVLNKTTESFESLCANTGTTSSTSSETTLAETYEINVTANSATNYILNGTDRNGSVTGNDPSVTVNVGDTLNFIVNAPGHPFYLKTVQGSGTANQIDGVTNAGTTNGTVSWTPTTAGTYYYQCAPHNSMSGVITVN